MFGLAFLAKQASTRPSHHFEAPTQRFHPPQSAQTRPPRVLGHARSHVAMVALSDLARALLQAPKRAGPQHRRASVLLQARKRVEARRHWAGEAGSLLESLLEDFGCWFIFFSFFLSSFSFVLFFSASRSAAFTLPLACLLYTSPSPRD